MHWLASLLICNCVLTLLTSQHGCPCVLRTTASCILSSPGDCRLQAKSTRDSFLQVFPEVFESLFRLCSDADTNVQNAASFLDNLVKVCACVRVLV